MNVLDSLAQCLVGLQRLFMVSALPEGTSVTALSLVLPRKAAFDHFHQPAGGYWRLWPSNQVKVIRHHDVGKKFERFFSRDVLNYFNQQFGRGFVTEYRAALLDVGGQQRGERVVEAAPDAHRPRILPVMANSRLEMSHRHNRCPTLPRVRLET